MQFKFIEAHSWKECACCLFLDSLAKEDEGGALLRLSGKFLHQVSRGQNSYGMFYLGIALANSYGVFLLFYLVMIILGLYFFVKVEFIVY